MYKEKTAKGFGDIAITNKGNSEFLIKVKELIEWKKLNKILQSKLKRNRKCSLEYRIKSMAFNLKKACYFF